MDKKLVEGKIGMEYILDGLSAETIIDKAQALSGSYCTHFTFVPVLLQELGVLEIFAREKMFLCERCDREDCFNCGEYLVDQPPGTYAIADSANWVFFVEGKYRQLCEEVGEEIRGCHICGFSGHVLSSHWSLISAMVNIAYGIDATALQLRECWEHDPEFPEVNILRGILRRDLEAVGFCSYEELFPAAKKLCEEKGWEIVAS